MVDLGASVFKYLNKNKITTEKLFTNAYAKQVYESEHVCTDTKKSRAILYAKYKNKIYITLWKLNLNILQLHNATTC